jgi:hypothetical protein
VQNRYGATGVGRHTKIAAAAVAGFATGFLGTFFNPDPIDVLGDIAKDLGGATTGRIVSRFGSSIAYDANATPGSQAVNVLANVVVNFAEGVWLGPVSQSVNPILRSAINGATKSVIGDTIRAHPAVPASYKESRHFEPLSKPIAEAAKEFGQGFLHDTAMSSVYGLANTGINNVVALAAGENDGNSALRAGLDNLQLANEADAIVGEMVLSGVAWDEVEAVPNETTSKASTESNLQAAQDKRIARSLRRNGRQIPLVQAA